MRLDSPLCQRIVDLAIMSGKKRRTAARCLGLSEGSLMWAADALGAEGDLDNGDRGTLLALGRSLVEKAGPVAELLDEDLFEISAFGEELLTLIGFDVEPPSMRRAS